MLTRRKSLHEFLMQKLRLLLRSGGNTGRILFRMNLQHRNHMFQQAACSGRGDHRITAVYCPNRPQKFFGRRIFQQKTACPGTYRRIDVFVDVEGRQHNNPGIRNVEFQNTFCSLQPVHNRHTNIHKNHLRGGTFFSHTSIAINRRCAVISFKNNL